VSNRDRSIPASAVRGCYEFLLTSRGVAFINVDVIEIHSMTALPSNFGWIRVTTLIVRMLGKAVKFRHCPATVSAPCFGMELEEGPG
jgi:hypothetical protein